MNPVNDVAFAVLLDHTCWFPRIIIDSF